MGCGPHRAVCWLISNMVSRSFILPEMPEISNPSLCLPLFYRAALSGSAAVSAHGIVPVYKSVWSEPHSLMFTVLKCSVCFSVFSIKLGMCL